MKNRIKAVILGLSFIIMVLTAAVSMAVYDKAFFMSEAQKNNVAENTGMTEREISEVTEEIFNYLKGERKDFDIVLTKGTEEWHLFNEDEQLHMIDVQNLMVVQRGLLFFSMFLVMISGTVLYRRSEKVFAKTLLISGISGIVLLILAGIIASGDFTAIFVWLHEMIFTNELWLMDPATEVLINIVPEPYFIHLALYTGGIAACAYLFAGVMGWFGLKKKSGLRETA